MCITRRLRLGITRRSFGCGLYSHEPSLTAHGVSSNEVVCHATELVARPRYRYRAVGPYSPVCPVQGTLWRATRSSSTGAASGLAWRLGAWYLVGRPGSSQSCLGCGGTPFGVESHIIAMEAGRASCVDKLPGPGERGPAVWTSFPAQASAGAFVPWEKGIVLSRSST